jgi:hypothetical protein
VLAAEILGGRLVIVCIEPQTLMFLDPDTRELLGTRPNPLTHQQALLLKGARPAGPLPRPRSEPVTVQRRVSATGVITVCWQKVSLGRVHAGRTLRVYISEHTLAIELDDEPARSAAPRPGRRRSGKAVGPTRPLANYGCETGQATGPMHGNLAGGVSQ